MGEHIELNDGNISVEVVDHQGVALVDFWAPWCGPCRMIVPVLEELAEEYSGRIKIGKLNIDENQKTATEFDIRSIPSLIIFKDGKEVERIIGVQSKEVIKSKLDAQLKSL